MSSQLTPFWTRFRKQRTRQLIADGMTKPDAMSLASEETRKRVWIARISGDEAAANAGFVVEIRPDGSFSVYAKLRESQIPPNLLPAAQAWCAAGRTAEQFH